MSVQQPEQQQQGCSLPNLLLPIFLIGCPLLGWYVCSHYGWFGGIVGVVIGFILIVPAVGVTIGIIIGFIMAAEKLSMFWSKKDGATQSHRDST